MHGRAVRGSFHGSNFARGRAVPLVYQEPHALRRLVEQLHAGLEKKNIHPDQTLHLARDMRRLQLDLDIAYNALSNMEACFAADVRCCPHTPVPA